MTDVEVIGPVARRRFAAGPCESHQGHSHNYDHVTVVEAGSVEVYVKDSPDGVERKHPKTYKAGGFFVVKKDKHHRIAPLEAGTRWSCIYWHKDHDGVTVEAYEGNDAAYV